MQRLRRLFCSNAEPRVVLQHLRPLFCRLTLVLASLQLATPPRAHSQPSHDPEPPVLVDDMDGGSPKLKPLDSANGFSVGQRSMDRENYQHGTGAERIHLRGPAGRAVQVAYDLSAAPVIDELKFRAVVRSNRAGIQLAARVVLPRSTHRSTGRPFELLVRGATVGRGRNWEVITLEQLPHLLANHARVARLQHGGALDEREAYVSQIVFLVPGGVGTTELLVDQISVFGVVNGSYRDSESSGIEQVAALQALPVPVATKSTVGQARQQIPRIIEWQGEPYQDLKQLGFNTLRLAHLPTAEELEKIEELGLSLVCPPPSAQQLRARGIGPEFAPVLAWDLGQQRSADDLAAIERWEQLVARHDPIDGRPTVLAPQLFTLEASRITDFLLVGRAVVGTELTVHEHTSWLAQRQRLARPGTPIWTMIETQLSTNLQTQISALDARDGDTRVTTYGQLTALTAACLGVKTRGIYFQSESPLLPAEIKPEAERRVQQVDARGDDSLNRSRALALELTNLRLQLAEPWIAAGKQLSVARSTQPELSGLVMQAERSHLLTPVWWSSKLRLWASSRHAGRVSFLVPGVAESSEAFLVTLGGMQRVRHQRVTGGIRISMEALPFDSFLLLSDDPQAISQVTRYLRANAPRATKIRRELSQLRLQKATRLVASLSRFTTRIQQPPPTLTRAERELATCDRHLADARWDLAYLSAGAVDAALDQLESELEAALGGQESQHVTALNHGPLSLIARQRLQKLLSRAPLTDNLLAGGGFENLASLLEAGWRHQQLPLDGITTAVQLSPEAPHSGSYCLELQARSLDEHAPTTIVPTSPVWITSAPVRVRAGDLLEITGVARLPERPIGSVDGLQIIDSLGGAEMALRILEAPSWQPFRLIRAATSDSSVSVTIAMSGLGRAQIDDIAIRVLQLPSAHRLDQAAYAPPARPR